MYQYDVREFIVPLDVIGIVEASSDQSFGNVKLHTNKKSLRIQDLENNEYILSPDQTKTIRQYFSDEKMRYGDIVYICDDEDNQLGRFVYDGESFLKFSNDVDIIAHLPLPIKVITNGLPVDYWADVTALKNSNVVGLDMKELSSQLVANYRIVGDRMETRFIVNDKTYRIINSFDVNMTEKIFLQTIRSDRVVYVEWEQDLDDAPGRNILRLIAV